jgi:hypothetical protein
MKGTVITISAAAIAVTLSSPALASHHHQRTYRHLHHHYSHYLTYRHWYYTHKYYRRYQPQAAQTSDLSSAPCHWIAKALGGPCGCETAWKILHVAEHVWKGRNLWLAWDWTRFPRAIPVNGTAAVWKNHSHVAPILHANNDGTVTVKDYWAIHKVRLSEVIVVDPHTPIKAGYTYEVVPL